MPILMPVASSKWARILLLHASAVFKCVIRVWHAVTKNCQRHAIRTLVLGHAEGHGGSGGTARTGATGVALPTNVDGLAPFFFLDGFGRFGSESSDAKELRFFFLDGFGRFGSE